jgi:hypothetical protein
MNKQIKFGLRVAFSSESVFSYSKKKNNSKTETVRRLVIVLLKDWNRAAWFEEKHPK